MEVDARVVDQVAHVVVGEAGVLARRAEEASANRLRERTVHRDAHAQVIGIFRFAIVVDERLGDLAERHARLRQRIARLRAMTALRALAGELPISVGTFKKSHGAFPLK